MSMLDGANPLAQRTTMGVFNNLIMFDQHLKQSSLSSIVPDLATGWSWNEDGTELTLPLRQGVKWHDGKPFSAKDVQCTWDLLLDKSSDKLRINTIKSWYRNLADVTTYGDYPSEAAAAGVPDAARQRLRADLSLPRADARDAPTSNWHRSVQIRRVQTERVYQGDAKCGLLEEGSALSRRHRMDDHKEYVDGDIGFYLGKVRHDFSGHSDCAAL
jgi:alkylated DNA nucleotide flippase Atl1